MVEIENAPIAKRLCSAALFACLWAGVAQAETVTIKVGYSAGGPNDVRARIVANHLVDHLPEGTQIVVSNVPGAGSAKLTRMLLNTEPSDGSVLAMISGSMPNSAILREELSDLKMDELRYVGNFSNQALVCVLRRDAGVNSVEDLREKSFKFGATGRGSATYVHAAIVKNALGASFDIVTGFKGVAGINAAIQRGEVAGRCGTPLATVATRYSMEEMQAVILIAPKGTEPALDAPTLLSVVEDETLAEAVEFATSDVGYYAPLLLPAGTPDDIVETYRTAFDAMMQEPDFRAEMEKAGLTLNNVGGATIEAWIDGLYEAEPDLVERARALTQ